MFVHRPIDQHLWERATMNLQTKFLPLFLALAAALYRQAAGHSFEYTAECSLEATQTFRLGYANGSHWVNTILRNNGVKAQQWDILITRNATTVFNGTKTTDNVGRTSRRVVTPGSNVGVIYLYATAKNTGEICTMAKFIE